MFVGTIEEKRKVRRDGVKQRERWETEGEDYNSIVRSATATKRKKGRNIFTAVLFLFYVSLRSYNYLTRRLRTNDTRPSIKSTHRPAYPHTYKQSTTTHFYRPLTRENSKHKTHAAVQIY